MILHNTSTGVFDTKYDNLKKNNILVTPGQKVTNGKKLLKSAVPEDRAACISISKYEKTHNTILLIPRPGGVRITRLSISVGEGPLG